MCSLCLLVLYTKESLPSRLEASLVCAACLCWFYTQNRAFPPDWRPLCFVWLVCIGSIYKREPSLQIEGLSHLYIISRLRLHTNKNLPSRLEASLFCIASLCCFYIFKRKPSLQIGGLSLLCSLSVLLLSAKESLPSRLEASPFLCILSVLALCTKGSLPSRLEASLCCVACLYWCYIQTRAFPPDWRPLCVV